MELYFGHTELIVVILASSCSSVKNVEGVVHYPVFFLSTNQGDL